MNQSTPKVEDIERGERLRLERNRLDLSQSELAKKLGVSKGSQILYEKGRPPTADYIAAIGALGADMFFILTGVRGQDIKPRVGTSVRRSDGTVIATYQGEHDETANFLDGGDDGFIRLPVYNEVAASAGPGALAATEHPDSVVAFARRFLRDQGAVPERCSIIRARGDSMVPTIPDASLLIVDHSQVEVANGCIMVISVGDDLLVKRVRRRLDGLIDLVSDNPNYPPETIGRDTVEQLRVVGRVVYFCRTP